MANPEQIAKLDEGVETWNQWRTLQATAPDLSEVDLSGKDLSGADLLDTNLRDVNFEGSNLNSADLGGADLNGAILHNTDLSWSRFLGTKNLDPKVVKSASHWDYAFYDDDTLKVLRLPPDHNAKLEEQRKQALQQK
jgi:hypothetical protein